MERIFSPHRQTVLRWIGQYVAQLPTLLETLLPVQVKDLLEVDEAWSFVVRKADKRGDVPTDTPDRCLRHWRPQCRHRSPIVAADSRGISLVSILQRFLAG
jgi:hypothetical protein